jgi:hypothetical protein
MYFYWSVPGVGLLSGVQITMSDAKVSHLLLFCSAVGLLYRRIPVHKLETARKHLCFILCKRYFAVIKLVIFVLKHVFLTKYNTVNFEFILRRKDYPLYHPLFE